MRHLLIPNRRPWNDLWLRGAIPFKTRGSSDKTFESCYGKEVYLYNSGRLDGRIAAVHGLTSDDLTPAHHIVAAGILQPFVRLSQREIDEFESAVWKGGENEGMYAMPFKLDLAALTAFKKPIPFAWPTGPTRHTWWEH